jgi:hypothetical protein
VPKMHPRLQQIFDGDVHVSPFGFTSTGVISRGAANDYQQTRPLGSAGVRI